MVKRRPRAVVFHVDTEAAPFLGQNRIEIVGEDPGARRVPGQRAGGARNRYFGLRGETPTLCLVRILTNGAVP